MLRSNQPSASSVLSPVENRAGPAALYSGIEISVTMMMMRRMTGRDVMGCSNTSFDQYILIYISTYF